MSTKDQHRASKSTPMLVDPIASEPDTSRALVPFHQSAGKPADNAAHGGAVDSFLSVVKKLFSSALTPGDVAAGRTNDVEAYVVGGEIVISTTTPDGIVLTARKKIVRRTLRWVRLWPYVTIVLALAAAILIVWRGDQILKLLATLATWK